MSKDNYIYNYLERKLIDLRVNIPLIKKDIKMKKLAKVTEVIY